MVAIQLNILIPALTHQDRTYSLLPLTPTQAHQDQVHLSSKAEKQKKGKGSEKGEKSEKVQATLNEKKECALVGNTLSEAEGKQELYPSSSSSSRPSRRLDASNPPCRGTSQDAQSYLQRK